MAAILGGCAIIFLYLGYRVGYGQDSMVYYKLNRLDQIIYGAMHRKGEEQSALQEEAVVEKTVDTTLLTMTFNAKKISNARSQFDGLYDNNGGAIDVYGDGIIFLDPKGRFYRINSLDDVKPLNVAAPDTRYNHYKKFVDHPEYGNTVFQKTPLKFNDVKYIDSAVRPRLLVSFTEFDENDPCYRNVVSSIDLDPTKEIEDVVVKVNEWQPIYKSDPCLPLQKSSNKAMYGEMAGGMIEVVDENTIFYANGDFFYRDIAQDPESDYGKILKISLDTGEKEIYSSGYRNPKGVELDINGNLWMVENGPRGGDEMNLVVQGANYGWPSESYGTTYFGGSSPYSKSFGFHDSFAKPVFSWLPSISPSEVIKLRGFHPLWDGDFIISSLVAQSLYRVRYEDGKVRYVEPIFYGDRIRDVLQLGNKLVMLTDSMKIVFASVGPIKIYDNLTSIFARKNPEVNEMKLAAAVEVCQQCHALFGNDNLKSPNLQKIYGDRVGNTAYQHYSEGVENSSVIWGDSSLAAFIRNPQSVVPGTSMPNPGISDPEDVENVVKFIKFLDTIK